MKATGMSIDTQQGFLTSLPLKWTSPYSLWYVVKKKKNLWWDTFHDKLLSMMSVVSLCAPLPRRWAVVFTPTTSSSPMLFSVWMKTRFSRQMRWVSDNLSTNWHDIVGDFSTSWWTETLMLYQQNEVRRMHSQDTRPPKHHYQTSGLESQLLD